ncbi:dephospho-CoA kinase [Cyanobium gracile]|uniref:Dephospho-CoA kinase n=1 Tax=Cyanobium gracile UHCC 0281 TaxID=3110309 RepID=A0ABU5SWV1_9CYAN|nr:dephospho-CoA kinase [Cyanobium gracile]MEA5443005.1 dephospho-CoA kinase [Cyanobium gracile UHCC 0281]
MPGARDAHHGANSRWTHPEGAPDSKDPQSRRRSAGARPQSAASGSTPLSQPQRRIGLTGGIATGKSTVAALLEQRFGLPVLDADRFAREALAPGSPGAVAVLARYGEQVRARCEAAPPAADACPALDRAALGRIVFADAAERAWLEGLVHPLVRACFAAELERLQELPTVVLMIPLLFEAGLESLCSEVWLVDCDETEQLRRLMARDGLAAEEATARMHSQWPMARKRALAQVVIDNSQPSSDLPLQLTHLLRSRPLRAS